MIIAIIIVIIVNKTNVPTIIWVWYVDHHEYSLIKYLNVDWERKERNIQKFCSHCRVVNFIWFFILLIIDLKILFRRYLINWNNFIIYSILIHLKLIKNNFFLINLQRFSRIEIKFSKSLNIIETQNIKNNENDFEKIIYFLQTSKFEDLWIFNWFYSKIFSNLWWLNNSLYNLFD